MIKLRCTNCNAALEIDDAFAGGACRCKHCGTIQTVPNTQRTNKSGTSTPSRTLYENKTRAETATGTGLDQLAEVVASSGLAGSGLSSARLRSPADERHFRQRRLILIVGGSVMVLLIALVLYFAMRHSEKPDTQIDRPVASSTPLPGKVLPPGFCGIKLEVPVVAFVLDRGNSSREVLGAVKDATLKSIESLGKDRRFQIIFWNNGSDDAFPSGQPGYATPENIASCRRWMEDINAAGQSDARSALHKAIASHPSAIVLITPKGWELDPAFVDMTLKAVGTEKVAIHSVAVGDAASDALKSLSQKTGGEYRTIDAAGLREFAQ